MFNYEMVPPVHTFHVDLREHGILLITMMSVSWLVTYLLRRQKQIAALEREQSQHTLMMMKWSEKLREVDDPQTLLVELHQQLCSMAIGCSNVVLGFQRPQLPAHLPLNNLQMEGFLACLKENKALGWNTSRYENLEDLYLPMRGKSKAYGVCLCLGLKGSFDNARWPANVQALLDQMGLACERRDVLLRIQSARELAQNQKIRSLFLTSIAHDQRTPLASIMTSASAIVEQLDQLSKDEIRRYAELIHVESEQVSRLTNNVLTLARLSGERVHVPMQEESVVDIVASVFQRLRQRKQACLPLVHVDLGLPLLKCNMVLVEQVLDNLIDNAIKHSGAPDTVELSVYSGEGGGLFQVSDRGKGMGTAHIEQGDHFRGMGIGLQLCNAVANVHSGRLSFSSNASSGTIAKFVLPMCSDPDLNTL